MTNTEVLILLAVLCIGLVAALLGLLAHYGVRKGAKHERSLLRHRAHMLAHAPQDADRVAFPGSSQHLPGRARRDR